MAIQSRCEEHDTLYKDVKEVKAGIAALESNTLTIAISAHETAKTTERILTNHLPHLQAGQDRAEQRLDKLTGSIAVLKKLINWLLALVGIGVAIMALGVALIGILQVME